MHETLDFLCPADPGFHSQVDVGFFPAAPYLLGRFSNGPVWIELVATLTGNALENLACGNSPSGAATGAFQVLPPFGYLTQTGTLSILGTPKPDQTVAGLSEGQPILGF